MTGSAMIFKDKRLADMAEAGPNLIDIQQLGLSGIVQTKASTQITVAQHFKSRTAVVAAARAAGGRESQSSSNPCQY